MNQEVERRTIEIDTDDVLTPTDDAYTPYFKKLIPDYSPQKYIDAWGMPKVRETCPEAWELVQKLWRDYDFMVNLERAPDVEAGFQILNNLDFDMVVHTHILSDDAARARREWLEALMIDADTNFEIDICQGKTKKSLENPYVTIEDNLDNLNRSKAKIKFLIRNYHNRKFTEKDIVGGEIRMVCSSFYEAALMLSKIESNTKNEAAAC